MTLSLQQHSTFFSWMKKSITLDKAVLRGYDEKGKQDALFAVAVLKKYKANVHVFTDAIVDFWPLPKRVMERYHFNEVEQLNEWLDDMG